MISLGNLVIMGGIFFSLLVCSILFFRNSKKIYANRLLSVTFLGFIWYSAIMLFSITGFIKYLTAIYGLGIPLYYATPVFAYLYTRAITKQQMYFSRRDWLHFLPAIFSFLAITPLYFADMETKQRVVVFLSKSYYNNFYGKMGLAPNYWHFILRPIQGIIYVVLQWRLILPLLKNKNALVISAPLKRWLIIFVFFLTLLYVNLALATILGISNIARNMDLLTIIRMPFLGGALSFLGISIYLFFFPEILYNIAPADVKPEQVANGAQLNVNDGHTNANQLNADLEDTGKDKETSLDADLVLSYAEVIQHYIKTQEFFRRQGVTINDLAAAVGISPRHVSYVLNNHFEQRFTDFINTYRVNYLINRFLNNDWRELSLEGLAKEAGFASRTTFFTAFKKHTGLNPTEYIQKAANGASVSASQDVAL